MYIDLAITKLHNPSCLIHFYMTIFPMFFSEVRIIEIHSLLHTTRGQSDLFLSFCILWYYTVMHYTEHVIWLLKSSKGYCYVTKTCQFSMAPWYPKFRAIYYMLAAAAVLQIFNSLCIVSKPVTKHISLAVRLFHRCGTHWRPAPLMWC